LAITVVFPGETITEGKIGTAEEKAVRLQTKRRTVGAVGPGAVGVQPVVKRRRSAAPHAAQRDSAAAGSGGAAGRTGARRLLPPFRYRRDDLRGPGTVVNTAAHIQLLTIFSLSIGSVRM
jgi:hypothetical protein